MKQPCVYMMASGRNGTLYVGVTADLIARVSQHRAGHVEGFTRKYGVRSLVWFEFHETMGEDRAREADEKLEARVESRSDPGW
jgi:putative endonuclease